MTTKYWLKIILGMLAVFAVGMVIATGIKKGTQTVHALVEGTDAVTLPMLGVPFMLGDAKLGAIQSMRIERDNPKQVSGFHLKVRLDDPQALATLATCQISLDDPSRISSARSVAMTSRTESRVPSSARSGRVTRGGTASTTAILSPVPSAPGAPARRPCWSPPHAARTSRVSANA